MPKRAVAGAHTRYRIEVVRLDRTITRRMVNLKQGYRGAAKIGHNTGHSITVRYCYIVKKELSTL